MKRRSGVYLEEKFCHFIKRIRWWLISFFGSKIAPAKSHKWEASNPLLTYRSGKRVPPQEIKDFLKNGTALVNMLISQIKE